MPKGSKAPYNKLQFPAMHYLMKESKNRDITKEEFDEFYTHVPNRVLIILDEAYFEFANQIPDYGFRISFSESCVSRQDQEKDDKCSGLSKKM